MIINPTKKMKLHFYIYLKSTKSILFMKTLTATSPYKHLECHGLIFHKLSIFIFAQIMCSYLRFSYRNILNPCPLMTVQNFAAHPGIIFLCNFYQLCINIDPVLSLTQSPAAMWLIYVREQMHAGKKWITSINLSLRVLN